MKLERRQWTENQNWQPQNSSLGERADVVLIFGETQLLKAPQILAQIRGSYPRAQLLGCSTAGEIHGTQVCDDSISVTAIQFENTKVQSASLHISKSEDSFAVGKNLASRLNPEDLTHVLVLSAGLNVNGSELVKGLSEGLPSHVTVTGGLAGDQDRFQETLVISNDLLANDLVAVVGLYGSCIQVEAASLGGWDPFGPERMVTKVKGNVLFEMDGKSALQVYKNYLGEHANDLPGSALLFPLNVRTSNSETPLVRTVLAVDEKEQSVTFAGDIPQGSYVRLMKANFDRLIEGAVGAAEKSLPAANKRPPDLALLISCVGRKLVLKQRVEEEIEGVRKIFGDTTWLTGFYSYGEISPFTPNAKCELHNQTMTITTLWERNEKAE